MEIEFCTVALEKRFKQGYIEVRVNGRWVWEHRYIVEQFIGRELTKDERIHHLNEIPTDNRIDNLMLFPNQKEHQAFHLKIKQFKITRPIQRQIENRWNDLNT
jgi:hypothetical protein